MKIAKRTGDDEHAVQKAEKDAIHDMAEGGDLPNSFMDAKHFAEMTPEVLFCASHAVRAGR